jgi:SAM-dependent methyltransferase
MQHTGQKPSPWVARFAPLIKPGGTVLDLACGSGRHLRCLAAQGFALTGVDRDTAAVEPLRGCGEVIVADVENGPWPLTDRRFDAVVVTNYLWRALLPAIVACVAPGGRLVYETFARGHERFGRPSRPDFLLEPGELLTLAGPELRVGAYEDGLILGSPDHPETGATRRVQRIVLDRVGADGEPTVLRL